MEHWQLDFEWLKVQHTVKELLNHHKLPDLQAILFLIGVQELGSTRGDFSKDEKQDLMHIAVCTLLSSDGYYRFIGLDQDGWPHFEQLMTIAKEDVKAQEMMLKAKIVEYFSALNLEGKTD